MTLLRTPPRAGWLFTKTLATGAALGLAMGCAALAPERAAVAHADLACQELPDASINPLTHRSTNMRVDVITSADLPGVPDDWEPTRVVGVKASMAAPPGWSRAFLERRILCYRATDEVGDLLLVDGSTIAVHELKGRFEVSVRSEDPTIARNIVAASKIPHSRLPSP